MAITFDALATNNTSTNGSLSFNHTIGAGSDRLLVVGFNVEFQGTLVVTTMTYDGVAMTLAHSGQNPGVREWSYLYYMDEANLPAAGTYSVSIVVDQTAEIAAGSASVFGGGQAGPEATATTGADSSGSTQSVNITTITNDAWIFDVMGSGSSITFTPTSPQVERWESDPGGSSAAGSTKELATAGLTTMEWTITGSNRDVLVVAAWPPGTPSATYEVVGVTKNNAGTPINGVDVYLYKESPANTFTFQAHTTSAGSGDYTFGGLSDNDANYHVQAKLDGSPNIFDCSDHVIVPVLE